jgi:streptogramin lyase
MDGVKNGNETDVDCGGMCPPCGVGKHCLANADCWDNSCAAGMCGNGATVTVGGAGNPALNPTGDGSKLVVLDPNGNVTVDRQTSLLNIARYIYVSNSGEGTVSKIDPSTFKEVARYCTAPGCNADPSRASVSLDGNVGVANRATYFYNGVLHPERASAVMIAGDVSRCVDRNGNGVIDTFQGSGPVPAQFMWPSNTTQSPDECVLWYTPLQHDRNNNNVGGAGTLPRAATFDSKPAPDGSLSSNFYVGLYGTNELVQLDAKTGVVKQQVSVPGMPYSSVFDRFGNLWIRDASTSRLIKVDTTQPNLPATLFGPAAPCGYAITADARGYIYSSGSNCVSRMDPSAASPSWESLTLPNACFTRGPSLDYAYNLWVPDTCYGGFHVDASKPFGQGMTLKKAIPMVPNGTGNYILGTAVDGNAFPFFINTEVGTGGGGANLQQLNGPMGTVYRVDPTNNYAVSFIRVGTTPYVYSDLSGSQLALSAPTTGRFDKNFVAQCGSKATWTQLTWTDNVPPQTSLLVRYRGAQDVASLQTAPFVTVGTEPPAIAQPVTINLPAGTNPGVLQVEFVISTSNTASKPTVNGLSVGYTCPP